MKNAKKCFRKAGRSVVDILRGPTYNNKKQQDCGGIMNSKSVYRKKRVGSCLALCLIGAVMSSTMSIPAWAAPASGTAKDDNTVVRDAIKGTPVGSLNANQEVKVKSEQKSEDGYTWYQISFDWNGAQTEGWVRGDLITDGASAADSTQTGSTTDQAAEAAGSVTSNNSGKTDAQKTDEFSINDQKYKIAEKFPETEIPEGFQAATITYGEKEISAAQMKNNADTVLVWLENTADSADKGMYLLDRERGEAVPFICIAGKEDSFVVLTDVPEAEETMVADCYHHTLCTFGNGSIMAYQLTQEDEHVSNDVTATDFYYVYGISSEGERGWYVYDSAGDTGNITVELITYQDSGEVPDGGIALTSENIRLTTYGATYVDGIWVMYSTTEGAGGNIRVYNEKKYSTLVFTAHANDLDHWVIVGNCDTMPATGAMESVLLSAGDTKTFTVDISDINTFELSMVSGTAADGIIYDVYLY